MPSIRSTVPDPREILVRGLRDEGSVGRLGTEPLGQPHPSQRIDSSHVHPLTLGRVPPQRNAARAVRSSTWSNLPVFRLRLMLYVMPASAVSPVVACSARKAPCAHCGKVRRVMGKSADVGDLCRGCYGEDPVGYRDCERCGANMRLYHKGPVSNLRGSRRAGRPPPPLGRHGPAGARAGHPGPAGGQRRRRSAALACHTDGPHGLSRARQRNRACEPRETRPPAAPQIDQLPALDLSPPTFCRPGTST